MTIGPATVLALIAAVLATLVYWIARRLAAPDWLCLLLFGLFLALVIIAGPVVALP